MRRSLPLPAAACLLASALLLQGCSIEGPLGVISFGKRQAGNVGASDSLGAAMASRARANASNAATTGATKTASGTSEAAQQP